MCIDNDRLINKLTHLSTDIFALPKKIEDNKRLEKFSFNINGQKEDEIYLAVAIDSSSEFGLKMLASFVDLILVNSLDDDVVCIVTLLSDDGRSKAVISFDQGESTVDIVTNLR